MACFVKLIEYIFGVFKVAFFQFSKKKVRTTPSIVLDLEYDLWCNVTSCYYASTHAHIHTLARPFPEATNKPSSGDDATKPTLP